jgi:hypothetical protein
LPDLAIIIVDEPSWASSDPSWKCWNTEDTKTALRSFEFGSPRNSYNRIADDDTTIKMHIRINNESRLGPLVPGVTRCEPYMVTPHYLGKGL